MAKDDVVQLWKRDASGRQQLVELRRGMFHDADAFQEALDFYESSGYAQVESGGA